DWDALRTAGCDTAQGYFIAPPMDAQAFGEFAMNYKFQPAPILSTSVTQSGQEQIKVLVIEDDNFTRKIIIQVLRGLGFSNAMDVNSAESAIILLESHTFDLVITDIHMPEMNGLKFIQMVRGGKTYAKPETRIVVLTSFSQTEVIGTALALDVNGFLVKPIIPAVVDEKLRKAMTERFPLHAPIAYEAIRTDLKSLHSELPRTGGKVGIIFKESSNHSGQHKGLSLSLHRLRPGMVLKENVYLRDGTLLLSGGHALSELSINRLNDLKVLLPNNGVIVQETF
ncbi:MAG TPA: response regulator, partial [Burkholderiales bacterium]|nr:response regulator [Burkholderiales bacterium]